jgi:vitamin B12 transporter
MARFGFLTILCFLTQAAVGQVADTTYLEEVRVYGLPITTYSTGSKVEQIKSGNDVETLSDKLISETSLYLKTYGNSQLSTITIRGTTSSQTAVLWNGMNINSPTLGQTDFSLIPLFLFDEVSVRYGTSSSLYGSDAIGGSIMIGQNPAQFTKGFSGTVYQQVGSFGKMNTGVKAIYGNKRWELRTKIYRSFIENDFPYESPAVGYSKKQNDAAVTNYGFDQQVHLKLSDTQQLSAEGMYTYNFREIQPAVTNDNANETLRDRHVRLSLNYQNDSRVGILSATAGYVFSDQDYTDDETSNVRSAQFTTLVSLDKMLSVKSNLRYGISYSHYSASSENFTTDVSENRYDAFVSFRYDLYRYWAINANLRQSLYAHHYAPFAPTLGTEVQVVHTEVSNITLRAQVARGFRVPTLNDRYWVPGGNPVVTPEEALNIEGGVNWKWSKNSWLHSLDGALYQSWVDDMIVWLPDGNVWSPNNLRKVNIHGVEVNAKTTFTRGKYQVKGNVIYAYTRSVNKKGLNDFDVATVDKQLAYVPIHSGRASASMLWNQWQFDVRLNVTGIRFTSLDNEETQALDPYGLVDTSLSKNFRIKKMSFHLRADVFNLFNVYYENLKNHAMPGRHYAISISINFNNKQTL